MVYLELSGGLPSRVWWEKFNSPDAAAPERCRVTDDVPRAQEQSFLAKAKSKAHQEYLAAGSQRVFERPRTRSFMGLKS